MDTDRGSAAGLIAVLGSMDPFSRDEVSVAWAVDGDEDDRAAIADALAAPSPSVLAVDVLQFLSRDPSPRVAERARHALRLRVRGSR